MRFDPVLLMTASELFVNLAAGWLGAAFIVPAFSSKPVSMNLGVLTMDIVFGILFLALAFKFKKLAGKL